MQTHISHSFGFGAGGNANQIQIAGWSNTESQHTWTTGKRSLIAIEDIVAPYGFYLEIHWQPFICYPYCLNQSVTITVGDHQISPYRITEPEIAAFYCPPPVSSDKKTLIAFDQPDIARISDYFETVDPRQVAIAFRRLRILPLEAAPPLRLKNSSSLSLKYKGDQTRFPSAKGEVNLEIADVLGQFEMLAGNCDLGLAMRALRFEQLSLLRFAGATTEVAIRGLETNFETIGEQLSTEIADNPIKEWLVKDAFGLRFHTHQSSEAMTETDILRRQRLHINFLRRKFLEDIQVGEKIFVYADHLRPRTFESALSLFLALNRRRKQKMLWVCPNFKETTPGRVDELVPGLARGSLDLFAGPLEAGHIALSGWVNVLFNAAVVLNRDTMT